jgi:tetratricopeptide (TPR) repeat protein
MDTRLKEVRQTDLTEGRLNQDFVDWLQTKGTSWLLVILVALCIYLGFVRWRSHQVTNRAEAWKTLRETQLPSALEKVAEDYAGIDAVSDLARIRAAQMLMNSVDSGVAVGAGDSQAPPPLTAEERETNLSRADDLYAKILQNDDQSSGRALIMLQALNGRGAVAESRGKFEEAVSWFDKAAKRIESVYPILADQARKRAADSAKQTRTVIFPAQADLMKTVSTPEIRQPVELDEWASELLISKDKAAE